MKKSSLLALTMASLVALVGCGESGPKKVSAEKFDEACLKNYEALEEKWEADPDFDPYHYYAKFSLKFKYKYTGYYSDAEDGSDESGTENLSFHIIYGYSSYSWEVDPDEAAAMDAETLSAANYVLSMPFEYDMFIFYDGIAESMEAYYAAKIEAGSVKLSWFTGPFGMKYESIWDEEEPVRSADNPVAREYGSLTEEVYWNNAGEPTRYIYTSKNTLESADVELLNGSYSFSYDFTIKYEALPEKYSAEA